MTLAALCAPSVHPDTTHDVAKTESGLMPLAIGVVGGDPIYPRDINDAMQHISRLNMRGKNYSVGLMQINKTNFEKYDTSARELFNPCTYIRVYEKIITDCYVRGGNLKRALSCYYSGRFDTGQKPETAFNNTSYVQRIGYAVPSTREDKNQISTKPQPAPVTVIYPSSIIRGDLPEPTAQQVTTVYPAKVLRGAVND